MVSAPKLWCLHLLICRTTDYVIMALFFVFTKSSDWLQNIFVLSLTRVSHWHGEIIFLRVPCSVKLPGDWLSLTYCTSLRGSKNLQNHFSQLFWEHCSFHHKICIASWFESFCKVYSIVEIFFCINNYTKNTLAENLRPLNDFCMQLI